MQLSSVEYHSALKYIYKWIDQPFWNSLLLRKMVKYIESGVQLKLSLQFAEEQFNGPQLIYSFLFILSISSDRMF